MHVTQRAVTSLLTGINPAIAGSFSDSKRKFMASDLTQALARLSPAQLLLYHAAVE